MKRRHLLNLGMGSLFTWPIIGRSQDNRSNPRLVNGPMVAAPSPDAIGVWIQGSEALEAVLEVERSPSDGTVFRSEPVRLSAEDDFCAVLRVDGLRPETPYIYRVLVNGRPDPYLGRALPFSTKTAPEADARRDFTLAMGSCARIATDADQLIWNAVVNSRPDVFLWLGDNVYGDSLVPDTLNNEYRRQRAVPSYQSLGHAVPQIAIWDDHDYGLNDHDSSNPVKDTALMMFKRYWGNHAYGLPDVPGIFFRQSYGAVDIFGLDCRYWRDSNAQPSTPEKTMLGRQQLEWLQQKLLQSRAVFKVLACGSGWSMAKGEGGDSWASFRHERDALFDFIRDNGIGGVVLVSGDTHVGELNVIPWSSRGGYDLYDFVTSPLAQPTNTNWPTRTPEQRVRPVFFSDNNFGWLRFEFDPEPKLTFSVVDSRGRFGWQPLTLTASQLQVGVESWRSVTDPSLQA